MIRGGDIHVWLATQPVDMRRSFDGLAEHVRAFLGHDPLSGSMFVFRNRSGHLVKILWWDTNGLAIYYKRLEKGTFQFPSVGQLTERTAGAATIEGPTGEDRATNGLVVGDATVEGPTTGGLADGGPTIEVATTRGPAAGGPATGGPTTGGDRVVAIDRAALVRLLRGLKLQAPAATCR